jgi:eukaryotic-like serine/threonine-protein kinase
MVPEAINAVWFCPLCYAEGDDPGVLYCPNDGGRVRPVQERGAEWIGRTLAGKYKVVRLVGSGGMADVYEVERVTSGKRLAVKILNPIASMYEGINERFRQEAMLISLIAHPNVVSLYDFGTLENQSNYMVMELLDGCTLKESLGRGPVGPHTACRIILQTAEGMAAAHERGVIHRDLKPDNLFLVNIGKRAGPMVKILDLGIGKLFNTGPKKGLTVAGTLLGTPEYMSPEQCNGDDVGIPSDIYSLGVVFYELLLGQLPFRHGSYLMILAGHVSEPPIWLRDVAASRGIPPEAEAVVLRALSKDPAKRQESMLVLQKDVAGILSRLRHGERYSLAPPPAHRATTVPPTPVMKVVPFDESTGAEDEVAEIADGIYWVGRRRGTQLECNAYLRLFKSPDHEISVLIDPGPPRDLETVAAKVSAVIGSMKRLNYVFLNHQDPDVAGNASAIQQMNGAVTVICSDDTWRLVQYSGFDPKRFMPTESMPGGRMHFATGHSLQLIHTPFCHFRGAVMLYDPEARVLFSGDLFGGTDAGDRFIADGESRKGMALFHEIYMPSRRALERAIALVRQLVPSPRVIAPQHGALLVGEEQQKTMDHLLGLKFGMDLIEENEKSPRALAIANDMITAFRSIAGKEAVTALFEQYSSDGGLLNILLLQPPSEVVGFRVDSRLAIETLLLDMSRSVPTNKKQALAEHLLPLRAKLSDLWADRSSL